MTLPLKTEEHITVLVLKGALCEKRSFIYLA